MNGFVVTYGPEPKVWCTSCRAGTPLVARLDGTLRPGAVEAAQNDHTCGQPPQPRRADDDEPSTAVGAGGER